MLKVKSTVLQSLTNLCPFCFIIYFIICNFILLDNVTDIALIIFKSCISLIKRCFNYIKESKIF